MMIETTRASRRSLLTASLALGGVALLGLSAAGNSKPAATPTTDRIPLIALVTPTGIEPVFQP